MLPSCSGSLVHVVATIQQLCRTAPETFLLVVVKPSWKNAHLRSVDSLCNRSTVEHWQNGAWIARKCYIHGTALHLSWFLSDLRQYLFVSLLPTLFTGHDVLSHNLDPIVPTSVTWKWNYFESCFLSANSYTEKKAKILSLILKWNENWYNSTNDPVTN